MKLSASNNISKVVTGLRACGLAGLLATSFAAKAQLTLQDTDRPDCKHFVFTNSTTGETRRASWNGGCKDGFAHGEGTLLTTLIRSGKPDRKSEARGEYVRGLGQGLWSHRLLSAPEGPGTALSWSVSVRDGLVHGKQTWERADGISGSNWYSKGKTVNSEAEFQAEQNRQATTNADATRSRATSEANEATRNSALNSALSLKDPQAMYLAASKFQRDQNLDSAVKVYEQILNRFPKSPFAVKANDSLNAIARTKSDSVASTRQAEAQRSSRPCDHVYVGKAFKSQPRGVFGFTWGYEVLGFSNSTGMATVREERGHSQEMSCSDIP
jgi:hypothetical protein